MISKDNFFSKFAHIYIVNIRKMSRAGNEAWDSLVDDVLPGLMSIALDILTITVRAIKCVLPIYEICETFRTQYLTKEELKQKTGINWMDGYYWKKEVKEMEAEYKAKLDAKASAAPMAGENVC